MSCKGILPQTRNGSGQIEDERKKEFGNTSSYCKNGEFSLAASRTISPDNNQDVAEDGINGENISPSVLEIASSNFVLPSSEITPDVVGVCVDDWFKTRSDGMDLDSVLTTDGIGVNDLEGYHFAPSKDNVDMCIVTNICDMGLGFDLPVNICDKNNQILSECDRDVNNDDDYERSPFLDDFDDNDIDKNLLIKVESSKINEESNLLDIKNEVHDNSYILQPQDKDNENTNSKIGEWNNSDNVYMETQPVVLSSDKVNWEALSNVSQQSTDYESEKDVDFSEFSLLTFQVDNGEGINVINSLSQIDCESDNNVVPANFVVSDGCVLSDPVTFTDACETEEVVGISKPRVIRGKKLLGSKIKEVSEDVKANDTTEGCAIAEKSSTKTNNCAKINSKTAAGSQLSLSNPRSLLRQATKSASSKTVIEPDSLVKKVSETFNILPTAVTSVSEKSTRQGPAAKKAPAMTIIAISTDKSKNTTEIVINTSQGEQKFKGKTSDFIKATSKLISNQPLKAKIGQSLNLSNMEIAQDETVVQQSENEDWFKYDKSKVADEQPITEALATLGIDLTSLNFVMTVGSNGYKLWECPTENCNKLYPRLSLLKVHILTHYGIRPYRCDVPGCQWTFYTFFKLKRHKETHLKRKAFVCPVPSCGHRFTTIYNLKTHRKLHERPAKLQCPVVDCDAHFQTKRAVELHIKKHGISHAPYQCTFPGCGKRYYSSNTLNSHARSHQHREEEVRCQWPNCGKWFDKPCRLKEHMRTHTGDKPYLCTFQNCGWAFSSASKLKRHQQKHTNERKFRCAVEGCGKSFMRSEHLKEHTQTHAEERSYQCTVENCGVKFTAKSSLYVHLKKHKMQMQEATEVAEEVRAVAQFQPADGIVTTSTVTTAVRSAPRILQQRRQVVSNGSGSPTTKAAAAATVSPVQLVMPVTSSSFPCPVESCPKSYSCKASLRQHLLKHHTPVLASDANQLDYVTSLLLSGGATQPVVVSSSDEQTIVPVDNLAAISAGQGPICTVAVTDVGNIDSTGLLTTGALFDTTTTYPSEFINTDLLNSNLNNMLVVSHPPQAAEDVPDSTATVLLASNRSAAPTAVPDADTELHLATESITDPLLMNQNYPEEQVVAFDLPNIDSEEEQIPNDPTCRAARTNLTFQDVVERKRPQQCVPAVSPSKLVTSVCNSAATGDGICSSAAISAAAVAVSRSSLGMSDIDGERVCSIAGLRDPVAALRLPPDMAGLLAPTADLNLLLQEDSGLQVLLLDGSESHSYAESTINLRDLE